MASMPRHSENMPDATNVAQLRDRIDRGEAGDKVSYPDPAAAPLGTDEEAAGTPPTRREIEIAWRTQRGPNARASGRQMPDADTARSRLRPALFTTLAIFVAVTVVTLAVWLLDSPG